MHQIAQESSYQNLFAQLQPMRRSLVKAKNHQKALVEIFIVLALNYSFLCDQIFGNLLSCAIDEINAPRLQHHFFQLSVLRTPKNNFDLFSAKESKWITTTSPNGFGACQNWTWNAQRSHFHYQEPRKQQDRSLHVLQSTWCTFKL